MIPVAPDYSDVYRIALALFSTFGGAIVFIGGWYIADALVVPLLDVITGWFE